MPSNDRRAAARRRAWGRGPIILRFEPLEERQLLATATGAALPDLVGASIATTQSADWGDQIEVQGEILNQGKAATSGPFNVAVYVSNTANLTSKAVGLGEITVPSTLAPGQAAVFDQTMYLPQSPIPGYTGSGLVYIGLRVDPENAIAESSKNNNMGVGLGYDTSTVDIVPQQPALLQGSSLTLDANQTTWGSPIQLTAQITNNAQGNAPATRAAIVLTPAGTPTGGSGDVTIGYLNVPAVPAWQTVNVTGQIVLPSVPPSLLAGNTDFTLSMVPDADYLTDPTYPHEASQGQGADQVSITINPGANPDAPQGPYADLAAGSVQSPTDPTFWGHSFQVTGTVQNVGMANAGPFMVDFLLVGANGSLSNPLFLGETQVSGLAEGASQTLNETLQLPNRLPSGTTIPAAAVGRIAMVVNTGNTVDEGGNLSNNISESNPMTLRLQGAGQGATVPTIPAVTTTPAPLAKVKTAGTLHAIPKKPPLTGPRGRSVPLHRHIVRSHTNLLGQVTHNILAFPNQARHLILGLGKDNSNPKKAPATKK